MEIILMQFVQPQDFMDQKITVNTVKVLIKREFITDASFCVTYAEQLSVK